MLAQIVNQIKEHLVTSEEVEYPHRVTLTSIGDEFEVGALAHDWLSDQGLKRGDEYQSSWRMVPKKRDHYDFVFKVEMHARLFKQRWLANVRN